MPVRNYDTPDPARVMANIRKVLEAQDMALLEKGSYQFLITHCGFIAHYDQQGFIGTYQNDLPRFVDIFLQQLGFGWETFLDNPRSYLYDVRYRGKLLADIIRELIPIFQYHQARILAVHNLKVRAQKLKHLRALAEEMGYNLVATGVGPAL